MKGSVSSSQAMLVLFFSPPESPLLSGPPMTVSKSKRGGEQNRRTIMTHCTREVREVESQVWSGKHRAATTLSLPL